MRICSRSDCRACTIVSSISSPGISVSGLLRRLQASKQYVNCPLRRLIELGYVDVRPEAEAGWRRVMALLADQGREA